MATTALVSEILVVGFEVEAWLAIFVLAAFGSDWIELERLQGWEALVTILVLAGAYVLGIVTDRIADSAVRWTLGPDKPGFAKQRLEVLHGSPGMAPFLEYQRSRLRVARGTLFNVVPAGASIAAFIVWGTTVDRRWLLLVLAVTVVSFCVTWLATQRIGAAYEKRLADAYSIVMKSDTSHAG